jgi:hypothetical protein
LQPYSNGPFWVCEQLRWRLADRIDNEGSAQ